MTRAAAIASALTMVAAAVPAAAQTGFTAAGAVRERATEAAVVASIEPDSMAAMSRVLSSAPHVAGTAAQAAVRDTLVAWMERWGLDPEVATYRVWLPHATAVSVALVAPDTASFRLGEPALEGDPATARPQYPWVNGYSAPGTARGPVVYANYGLHEDYDALEAAGVDVAGAVVLARYGGSFRGIKARLAEAHGAAALVLFSDPADDGYVRGDVYPEGPYRPWEGVQRGSVLNGAGDPTTPTGPSTPDAERTDPADVAELPGIPVVPVSYAIAREILDRVRGADLPDEGWQGGLPLRYHLGPGPAVARVSVEDDREGPDAGMKPLHDVLARVEGAVWPEEVVVVGGHVDAWGPGAEDNVSGATSVWSAARAVASRLAAGERPRRTIVFAGWDGEEWGLIGSTEWVEEHAGTLIADAVAYLNQDAIGGTRFGAGGSPSLGPLAREAARAVPAGEGRSVHDAWVEAQSGRSDPGAMVRCLEDESGDPIDCPEGEETAPEPPEPDLRDLGGGSDFAAFYHHLGVPALSFGFGSPGGVYHSGYDTWRWMAEHGDPGFTGHARSSALAAVLALRLANAEVLPYDYATYARVLADRWSVLEPEAAPLARRAARDALGDALEALERAGERANAAREAYLSGEPDPDVSRRANAALRSVERAVTRPRGLEGRPWYRNLAFASDRRNGYATIALPSVAEAVRSGESKRVEAEIADLAARIREAAGRVSRAAEALGG